MGTHRGVLGRTRGPCWVGQAKAGTAISSRYHGLRRNSRAVISLSEHANRIVNVVKARDGLKGKSEAIDRIVEQSEEHILDPGRPLPPAGPPR